MIRMIQEVLYARTNSIRRQHTTITIKTLKHLKIFTYDTYLTMILYKYKHSLEN